MVCYCKTKVVHCCALSELDDRPRVLDKCKSTQVKEYLTSDTTLSVMYDMYKAEYPNPVSLSKYRDVFYKKFNLQRKQLKKDTCNKCDTLVTKASSATSAELKQDLEKQHKDHLDDANKA